MTPFDYPATLLHRVAPPPADYAPRYCVIREARKVRSERLDWTGAFIIVFAVAVICVVAGVNS